MAVQLSPVCCLHFHQYIFLIQFDSISFYLAFFCPTMAYYLIFLYLLSSFFSCLSTPSSIFFNHLYNVSLFSAYSTRLMQQECKCIPLWLKFLLYNWRRMGSFVANFYCCSLMCTDIFKNINIRYSTWMRVWYFKCTVLC